MKFALLLPTRGRPKMLKNALDSLERTMSGKNEIAVYLGLDADDKTLEIANSPDYPFDLHQFRRDWGHHLGKIWNCLYGEADADVYMLALDDMVFMSEDWDRAVAEKIEEFPDRIVMIWGDNMWPGRRKWPYTFFLTDRVCKTVGYFVWGGSPSWFHETWNLDVFRRVGEIVGKNRSIFLEEVKIKMLHPDFEGMKPDETMRIGTQMRVKLNIGGIYGDEEHKSRRRNDARKLAEVIKLCRN